MPSRPPTRTPIAPLPAAEVAKICAGEVVERPLSVVKELVENALDAGARHVTVELKDGGRRLIRVVDDGHGIPAGELELALKPHHTSKVTCLDDLFGLTTLGFRGEALSAMATVSQLTLTSRHSGDEQAGRVEVHGGGAVAHSPSNLQRGTEVEVRELFFNTPARLKFLRHAASETSQISALLTAYALAYPEVRFELLSGGRCLLSSDGDGNLEAVTRDLLGRDLAESLARVDFEFPPSAVQGFISAPHRHWHNRTRQWYFVNRRPVNNRMLYKAVDDAVREFISPGKFPAGVFFIDVPPEEIDVNVHPAKAEINFAHGDAIYTLLTTGVRRALGRSAAERQRRLTKGMSLVVTPVERGAAGPAGAAPPTLDFRASGQPYMEAPYAAEPAEQPELDADAGPRQRAVPLVEATAGGEKFSGAGVQAPGRADSDSRELEETLDRHQAESPAAGSEPGVHPDEADITQVAAERVREVLQVADTYLVLVTDVEVYLIDQHAAHERILFEQLWRRYVTEGRAAQVRQGLMFPLSVPLGAAETDAAAGALPALERLGFAGLVSGGALEITEVPLLLAGRVTEQLIRATLDELLQSGSSAPLDDRLKLLCATLACRAAIKAGQRLPEPERLELVQQLLAGQASLSCPHGRPTVLRLDAEELGRMFLR